LSEYLTCFGEKPACSSLAGTGALLVKQLGRALACVTSFGGSLLLPDKPNTQITKPSNKPLLMARKMMSCLTFGPADRAGRGRRGSEMLEGLKNHRVTGCKRPPRSSSPTIRPTPPFLLNHILKCHIYIF